MISKDNLTVKPYLDFTEPCEAIIKWREKLTAACFQLSSLEQVLSLVPRKVHDVLSGQQGCN